MLRSKILLGPYFGPQYNLIENPQNGGHHCGISLPCPSMGVPLTPPIRHMVQQRVCKVQRQISSHTGTFTITVPFSILPAASVATTNYCDFDHIILTGLIVSLHGAHAWAIHLETNHSESSPGTRNKSSHKMAVRSGWHSSWSRQAVYATPLSPSATPTSLPPVLRQM